MMNAPTKSAMNANTSMNVLKKEMFFLTSLELSAASFSPVSTSYRGPPATFTASATRPRSCRWETPSSAATLIWSN